MRIRSLQEEAEFITIAYTMGTDQAVGEKIQKKLYFWRSRWHTKYNPSKEALRSDEAVSLERIELYHIRRKQAEGLYGNKDCD